MKISKTFDEPRFAVRPVPLPTFMLTTSFTLLLMLLIFGVAPLNWNWKVMLLDGVIDGVARTLPFPKTVPGEMKGR